MIVDVQGAEEAYNSGTGSLLVFTNLGKESCSITISNGGDTEFDYKVETSAAWIKVDDMQASILSGKTITVSIDWIKVSKTLSGFITISGAGEVVKVNILVEVIDTVGLPIWNQKKVFM